MLSGFFPVENMFIGRTDRLAAEATHQTVMPLWLYPFWEKILSLVVKSQTELSLNKKSIFWDSPGRAIFKAGRTVLAGGHCFRLLPVIIYTGKI